MKLQVVNQNESADGSIKFLWKLSDGQTIESVILPPRLKQRKNLELWTSANDVVSSLPPITNGRFTACVSSQVGCAMACDFCVTGKQGFARHLSADEIIQQVIEMNRLRRITNVVFMGMGEPLHALDSVLPAIRWMRSPAGLHLSRRNITVSTSGLISGFEKLADTGVKLAISLNATTDLLRNELMPVNRRYPIASLIQAAKEYSVRVNQAVMVEYILLKDLNDSLDDSMRLIELARGWKCKVNLIPYNPSLQSDYQRPQPHAVKAFQHQLVSNGITATVRYSGGDDIFAACGQLRSQVGA